MNAKTIAFQRGIAMLRASGAYYAVVYEGVEYTSPDLQWAMKIEDVQLGNLQLHTPSEAGKRRAPDKQPRRSWLHTGYLDAIKGLQPGANWTYPAGDKEEAVALQKAVAGRAGQLWGPGNFITTVDDNFKLEVLRVE